ncbi:MAG: 5,10-methylenetetrahydrofolate reductase, partial [Desulfuromonas sp.]
MGVVSIELVPRSEAALEKELQLVKNHFPAIDTINIPDLLNFDLRSWQGGAVAQKHFPHVIPHLRAIDFDLDSESPFAGLSSAGDFAAMLVITGDRPQDMSRRVYRTSVIRMIRSLKAVYPDLKIFAGIDPYRSGIKEELDYARRKVDAGADGFFTQPFFDLRLMEIYRDLLAGYDIYWGVSPVTSDRSRDYWENRNNAIFPPDFEPTMKWNRDFARRALDFIDESDGNVYFMPIRV